MDGGRIEVVIDTLNSETVDDLTCSGRGQQRGGLAPPPAGRGGAT